MTNDETYGEIRDCVTRLEYDIQLALGQRQNSMVRPQEALARAREEAKWLSALLERYRV